MNKRHLNKVPEPLIETSIKANYYVVFVFEENILTLTVYDKTRDPYVKVFLAKDSHITYKYQQKKWSNATILHFIYSDYCYCADIEVDTNIHIQASNDELSKFCEGTEKSVFEKISNKQVEFNRLKRKKSHDDTQTFFTRLPCVPKDLEEWVVYKVFQSNHFMIYKKTRKQIIGYCSYCENQVQLKSAAHKSSAKCPSCGNTVLALSEGIYMRSNDIIRNRNFTITQKIDSTLVIRYYAASKYDRAYRKHVQFNEYLRITIETSGKTKLYCKRDGIFGPGYYQNSDTFFRVPEFALNYSRNFGFVIRNTFFDSDIVRYLYRQRKKFDIRDLLHIMTEFPFIHELHERGYQHIFSEILSDIYSSARFVPHINLREKSCEVAFEMTNAQLELCNKYSYGLNIMFLYRLLKRYRLSDNLFKYLLQDKDLSMLSDNLRYKLSTYDECLFIENLVKQGYNHLLNHILFDNKPVSLSQYGDNFIFHEARITKGMKMSRDQVRFCDEHDFDLAFLTFYRDYLYGTLRPNEILMFHKWYLNTPSNLSESIRDIERLDAIEKLTGGPGNKKPFIRKLYNHLYKHSISFNDFDLSIYKDYIMFSLDIGIELKTDVLLFPVNLKEAHDEISFLRQMKRRAEEFELYGDKIVSLHALYEPLYKKELNGLMFMVPTSFQSIIKEGNTLGHCVGNYITKYVKKECVLIFIRSVENPECSMFTMEIVDNKLKQVKGYKNFRPNDDIYDTLDEYLKLIPMKIPSEIIYESAS